MKKIKYGNVDTDNPLNWTQEDFDEVIYDFINVRVLSGQPIPPAINKWYCAVSQDIQKKRMGIVETTETDADRYRKALEGLKKEIINKNEKIKELRLSVSDLTNRLCYLNAEKSFRIVDLEQALDEIAAHYQKVIKNITNYDDSYDASISIKALHNISDIINKAKDGN